MSNYTQDILLHGTNLALGENLRVLCPCCNGGSKNEKTLSITLCEDGVLKWQCFKASCTLDQGTSSRQYRLQVSREHEVRKRKVFDGETHNLSPMQLEWVHEHWGIVKPPHWYYTNDYGGRIAMSVRSPKYEHRGWVLRDIRGMARTKALTYLNEKEIGLSWYRNHKTGPTILVEDIPSAVRASPYLNACALLGTALGVDKAIEIAEVTKGPVIIALDQDATDKSFKMNERYALLFGEVIIRLLPKDIKDMEEKDVERICNV